MCIPFFRPTSPTTTRTPLALNRDTHGAEGRNDVGDGGMRWITVGPADRPRTSIVLEPPGTDPRITDADRRTLAGVGVEGGAQVSGSRPCACTSLFGASGTIVGGLVAPPARYHSSTALACREQSRREGRPTYTKAISAGLEHLWPPFQSQSRPGVVASG